jgi:predicted nucleotidyltransferase
MALQHRWESFRLHEASKLGSRLIVPTGTQVVLRSDVVKTGSTSSHPIGEIAEIILPPKDGGTGYTAKFADGTEAHLQRQQFSILKQVKAGPIGDPANAVSADALRQYIVYECIVGSRAFGLDRDDSDVDRRGVYLPPAELQWSLYGVPEQLEFTDREECYWEFEKFIGLALKANPNILECLYTPLVERTTEVGSALLESRTCFLSKLVYQTYNGYVLSQFKKLEQDLRTAGEIKWKHAMHLIRLLLQGITVLRERIVPVPVGEHRAALLAVRDGLQTWEDVNHWRLSLHNEFEAAYRSSSLPESPDYSRANELLLWARRKMVEVKHVPR